MNAHRLISMRVLITWGIVAGWALANPWRTAPANLARSDLFAGPDDLRYSTYLGGANIDQAYAVAAGPDGDLYIAGYTASSDLPTTPGALQTTNRGGEDAFVARLDPVSGPVYITYLGGTGTDQAFALAVDGVGAAYAAGWTNHESFPRTPGAPDNQGGGLWEGFVAKLSPDGSQLEYSTFLGGRETDRPRGIAVEARGAATIVGSTLSPDFPITAGAFDTACGSNGQCDAVGSVEREDAFVTRLNPAGTAFEFSTFLGGSNNDFAFGVALDAGGQAYVTGPTWSADLPVTPEAFDTANGGNGDGFVAVVEASGAALAYARYLGGGGTDTPYSVAAGVDGAVYVAGMTSGDFPTTPGAFDTAYNGGAHDAFVVALAPGGALAYATLLGGARDDYAYGIAVGAAGTAYVTGGTRSADFPATLGAFDPTFNGHFSVLCEDGEVCPDLFIAAIAPGGSTLAYSTFVGDKYREWGEGLAVGPGGQLYVAGVASQSLPTTALAFDPTFNGVRDACALILATTKAGYQNWLPLVLRQ